ncbi:hypothetical protein [Pararhizobium sp. IMCC21322]|uniref:hypothetical protein n=1 Tax=Pararhizobium sp. IMCC21322 TaxID=3067903 RepID=UPI0027428CA9|nr:hypothetical protein [Pararhizobium sp. IMCC21322]
MANMNLPDASEPHEDAATSANLSSEARGRGLGTYVMGVSYRKSSGLNFARLSKDDDAFEVWSQYCSSRSTRRSRRTIAGIGRLAWGGAISENQPADPLSPDRSHQI